MSKDTIEQKGVVKKIHPGGIFNVDVVTGEAPNESVRTVNAKCSGKMNKYKIRLTIGDRVDIEFSPYDLFQGRITRRLKPNEQ